MENPEELLHSLEEFSKIKPRDIPRELEEYLCFVAKTGDPIYQWPTIKTLFREKLINVITEFYESCASMDIPACPNVEIFNYETMKGFILEKLDTFVAAPFTVQRICELLTAPRKEYNRIDKYMRALEKNILVVSTTEPGGRTGTKNGDSVMNGIDSDHTPETSHCNNDINVEEMDDSPSWRNGTAPEIPESTWFAQSDSSVTKTSEPEVNKDEEESEEVTSCKADDEKVYVSIQSVEKSDCKVEEEAESSSSVTITPVPATVQSRRDSVEPEVSSEGSEENPPAEKATTPPPEDKETNEAENKEEVTSDEPRIILTSTDAGIENISPESSTSSPETLQNDFESAEANSVDAFETPEKEVKPEPSSNTDDPVIESTDATMDEEKEATPVKTEVAETSEEKDFEVSSSVDEVKPSSPATTDIKEEFEDIPKTEEIDQSGDAKSEVKVEKVEEPDTPMDVDSSSDKTEDTETETPEIPA